MSTDPDEYTGDNDGHQHEEQYDPDAGGGVILPPEEEGDPNVFNDPGAGPEEDEETLNDPANASAANAIRASSIERNND